VVVDWQGRAWRLAVAECDGLGVLVWRWWVDGSGLGHGEGRWCCGAVEFLLGVGCLEGLGGVWCRS
jgi:hypothetical protein